MTIFARRTIQNKADGTFTSHALARLDDGAYALLDTAGLPDTVFVRVPLGEEAALAVLQTWPDNPEPNRRGEVSAITEAGHQWLLAAETKPKRRSRRRRVQHGSRLD